MSGGTGPSAFPWDDVLHLALCILRWSPDQVWRATPRELAWALRARRPGAAAPSGADLATLMQAFPDGV